MSAYRRMLVAAVLIIAAGVLARAARTADRVPATNLEDVPMTIGDWSGRDAGALDDESLRIVAADAYLNRSYQTSGAHAPVGLYVAYYAVQRPGVSIHSPLNCLPGAGWEPLEVQTIPVPGISGAAVPYVRRMLVSKNLDRALVLYWYAVHGRVLADEIASKMWLLHDSLWLHRSDAALVRVVVPVGQDAPSVDIGERQGLGFIRSLLPYLSHAWS